MSGNAPLGAASDPDRIAERIAAMRGGHTAAPGPESVPPGSPGNGNSGKRTRFAGAGRQWARAGVVVVAFVVALYVIELIDALTPYHWLDRNLGVEPREVDGLDGVVFAPVLHGGWDHLAGNTLPVLILGFLTLATGIGRGVAATAIIWLFAGAGTWLVGGAGTIHIGASSLVFGWLAYLICRGWFVRRIGQIALGLVVLAGYGSLLWGVLPGQDGISWQGHLFGALGGVLAGWVVSRGERRQRRQHSAGPPAAPR